MQLTIEILSCLRNIRHPNVKGQDDSGVGEMNPWKKPGVCKAEFKEGEHGVECVLSNVIIR